MILVETNTETLFCLSLTKDYSRSHSLLSLNKVVREEPQGRGRELIF